MIFFFDDRFEGRRARLFQLRINDGNHTAIPLFQINLPTTSFGPVALSLSRDSCELLIKQPDVVYYIPIVNGQFLDESIQSLPYKPNADEKSIAWNPRQDRYYTVSESEPHTLKVAFRNRNVPRTRFTLGKSLGTIDNTELEMLVALASSRKHLGFMYTVSRDNLNDIFIVQIGRAQPVGKIHLGMADARARDIATGPCPFGFNASDCIYVSTVTASYITINQIFIFREPDNVFADTEQVVNAANELTYTLPLGKRRAWAIFVGNNGQIYIMDYVLMKEIVTVFELNQNMDKTTAVPVANFTSHSLSAGPVAADISPCNNEILVKFRDVVLLFDVEKNNVVEAFIRDPIFLPYIPEREGQAIAFSGCDAFLTTSTQIAPTPLLIYRRVKRSKYRSKFGF